jgi:hypothetical protein
MGFAGLWRGNFSNVMRVVPTYGARCLRALGGHDMWLNSHIIN